MGNTVNRPSQANQQWVNVKDANGNVTLKRNVAYSGRTNRGTGRGVPDARRVANDQPPVNWSLEEMDVLFDGMDMDKANEIITREPMNLGGPDSAVRPAFDALVAGTQESAADVKKWPPGLAEERLARLTEMRTDHWNKKYQADFEEMTNLGLTDLEAGEQGYGDVLRYEYAGLLRDDDSLSLEYADIVREEHTNVKKRLIERLRNR